MDVQPWVKGYTKALRETFGNRLKFVGLQGSYARGEARETSDIDMVVILDELTASDLKTYSGMLDTLPHREKMCGFLAGEKELLCWEASDLFSLYYDTRPILGSLDAVLDRIDGTAVQKAIQTGVCNIFHGCVHNRLYGKSEEALKGLYKSASFAIRAMVFRETGKYVRHPDELLLAAQPGECRILNVLEGMRNGEKIRFEEMSDTLFAWAQGWIGKE